MEEAGELELPELVRRRRQEGKEGTRRQEHQKKVMVEDRTEIEEMVTMFFMHLFQGTVSGEVGQEPFAPDF